MDRAEGLHPAFTEDDRRYVRSLSGEPATPERIRERLARALDGVDRRLGRPRGGADGARP